MAISDVLSALLRSDIEPTSSLKLGTRSGETTAFSEEYALTARNAFMNAVEQAQHGQSGEYLHDISILFSQCNGYTTKLSALQEASKILDVEQYSYIDRLQQLELEKAWLSSDAFSRSRDNQKDALGELEKEIYVSTESSPNREAYIQQSIEISDRILSTVLSEEAIVDAKKVANAIEELRPLGGPLWTEKNVDGVYLASIKTIVQPPAATGNRGTLPFYFLAAAQSWLFERDLKLQREAALQARAELGSRLRAIELETADLNLRKAALAEANGEAESRLAMLISSISGLKAAYNGPGFSYESRLTALFVEFAQLAQMLFTQCAKLSSAVAARYGYDWHPIPSLLQCEAGLESSLAQARLSLLRLGAKLDEFAANTSIGWISVPLRVGTTPSAQRHIAELKSSEAASIIEIRIGGHLEAIGKAVTIELTSISDVSGQPKGTFVVRSNAIVLPMEAPGLNEFGCSGAAISALNFPISLTVEPVDATAVLGDMHALIKVARHQIAS